MYQTWIQKVERVVSRLTTIPRLVPFSRRCLCPCRLRRSFRTVCYDGGPSGKFSTFQRIFLLTCIIEFVNNCRHTRQCHRTENRRRQFWARRWPVRPRCHQCRHSGVAAQLRQIVEPVHHPRHRCNIVIVLVHRLPHPPPPIPHPRRTDNLLRGTTSAFLSRYYAELKRKLTVLRSRHSSGDAISKCDRF